MGNESTKKLFFTVLILSLTILPGWISQLMPLNLVFPIAFVALGRLRRYEKAERFVHLLGMIHHLLIYLSFLIFGALLILANFLDWPLLLFLFPIGGGFLCLLGLGRYQTKAVLWTIIFALLFVGFRFSGAFLDQIHFKGLVAFHFMIIMIFVTALVEELVYAVRLKIRKKE